MTLLFYLLTLFFFASMEVVSKPLMGTMDPLVLTMWRFVLGTFVLAAAAALGKKRLRQPPGTVAILALMGFMNTFLSMSLLQMAVKHTNASTAAAVFCSNPVFVVLAAAAMGWERFTGKRLVGLISGLGGLVFLTGMHRLQIDRGSLYALLASVCFAIYILAGRKASLRTDPVIVNVVSFCFGIAALFVWLLVRGVNMSPAPLLGHIPSFLFMGAGISGLAYITFISTIRKIGAGNASTVFLLKPAVATALAVVFLAESLTIYFVLGLILTGSGSLLVSSDVRPLPTSS
jgi:drug/metabolite transporter (DMT)-like permease